MLLVYTFRWFCDHKIYAYQVRNAKPICNKFVVRKLNETYQYILVNRAGETTEGRSGNAGAPSWGIAKPGGGMAKLDAAAAAAARAGDVRPKAVVNVAAAVANVGLRRADRPATYINKMVDY